MLPVNVISGFLGAGKTSVLLDCLAYLNGRQDIAVIENEFGHVNVDAARLQDKAQYVYEISKGCICCSLQDELNLVLNALADIKSLDRLMIEPSGVFIVETLLEVFNQPKMSKQFYIESITVVVDAASFPEIAHLPFVQQQIRMATTIVINKTDQCKQLDSVVVRVKRINPDSNLLLRANKLEKKDVPKLFIPQEIKCLSQGLTTHQFKTQLLDCHRFQNIKQLEQYLINKGKTLIRAKGRVHIQGQSFEVSYTLSGFNYWQLQEEHTSESNLVLIYR